MSIRSVAGSQGARKASQVWPQARDVFAGSIAGIVTIAYGLSFAALIFAPPLQSWLAYGVAATFITSAIGASFVAARSSLPFAIAGPDGATAAVTATLAATVAEKLVREGHADTLLAPVMIVVALATALTGLLLFGLGYARAGGAIRFIPYPVIGGFLSATGWLMVSGAVHVITDRRLERSALGTLLEPTTVLKLAAAGSVALALHFALRRARNPWLLPGVLLLAAVLAHAAFALSGMSLSEALAQGWTFDAPAAIGLAAAWNLDDVRNFPWRLLPGLSADIFAVMFVTAITMLLNTTGIEHVTRREANLQRELTTLGAANLAASALGGYVSCMSLSRTNLTYVAGGRGRICGLAVASVSALMLIANLDFLGYVPKFVLGGLLLYLGASLMYEWLVDAARRISLLEYASLLAIALLIVQVGFIAGVLIGVIIGCATFAVSASRVNATKFTFDGSEYRSSLDRGPEELAILATHGHEIQGISLQSYLFFGSANRLYQQVKALFQRRPDTRFLVFDFRLVTGIDSSAMHSFTQIKRAADELGARLVLVNLPTELRNAFRARDFVSGDVTVSSDLDRALEACELAVIAAHSTGKGDAGNLRDWLIQALGSAEYAEQLSRLCERRDIGENETIAEQGDPASSMHFILEGRIGIIVKTDDGRLIRVRSLGPYTTIGEMGLVTRQLRSATIQAEVPSVLYELSGDAYERLKRDNSALAQALLTYIVRVMAERLSFASRVIGVLRR